MQSDLAKVIKSTNDLSEDHVAWIMYQIIRAVCYMHSAKVVHRDLKPANVLVNSDVKIKIGDLGLSRSMAHENDGDDKEQLTEYVVPRWYRAPEIMVGSNYDYAIDMWSIGCILAELFNRDPLFQGTNYVDQLAEIFHVIGTPKEEDMAIITNEEALGYVKTLEPITPMTWSEIAPSAPEVARDLLSKLLVFDPQKRITARDALEHPFFAKLRRDDTWAEKQCSEFTDLTYEKLLKTDNLLKDIYIEEIAKFRPSAFFRKPSFMSKRKSQHGRRSRSTSDFSQSI